MPKTNKKTLKKKFDSGTELHKLGDYTWKVKNINGSSKFSYFYLIKSPSNCKLCTLESIQNQLGRGDVENTAQAIKDVFNYIDGYNDVFYLTTNRRQRVDNLAEYFPVIFVNRVPIGYHGNFQYHALFASPKLRSTYEDRLVDDGVKDITDEYKEKEKCEA